MPPLRLAFRTVRLSSRVTLLALGAAALLAPGAPSQAFGGLPLDTVGLCAAAVLVYACVALPHVQWRSARWLGVLFACACALKLALFVTAPPIGLTASYWAKPMPDGPAERYTNAATLPGAAHSRTPLDLRGETFGVTFFNDASRFNFGPDIQPGRDQLPFSARWEGWLLVPSDGQRQLMLQSIGPARVVLDRTSLLETASAEGLQVARASPALSAGLHELQ